jgi:HEAT repeat protein
MRLATLLPILCLFAVGCGGNAPKEKYFSGEPVEHWLEAIHSRDAKVRKKAADVLGNVGPIDPRAIAALTEAVHDPDPKVRDAAVLGLSKIGPDAASAEPALQEATKDRDATVRAHAATAIDRVRGTK